MKATHLIIIVLTITLVGTVVFGAFYLMKRNPAETLAYNIPISITGPTTPTFKFAIYGEGANKLARPMAVIVANNRIYVSDSVKEQVFIFELDGTFVKAFGEPGDEPGQFRFPYGLAVDRDGNIYVADMKNQRIQVFDQDGQFLRVFERSDGEPFGSVAALAIHDGQLYVTELPGRISVFKLSGEKVLEIRDTGTDTALSFPNGIAVDGNGDIYVADSNNNRILVFDSEGKLVRSFDGSSEAGDSPIGFPRGIAISNKGVVFVVSSMAHKVYGLSREGERYFAFGTSGVQNDEFQYPNGIFIDSMGRIYITDKGNQAIKVYAH